MSMEETNKQVNNNNRIKEIRQVRKVEINKRKENNNSNNNKK